MNSKKEALKSVMIDSIRSGGAWFSTRPGKFVKIGLSEADNCYFARECFSKDGTLEGGAYSFGTDWFDISFHGRYIDIYVDPDTFKEWSVVWNAEYGTKYKGTDECVGRAKRILDFCKEADKEAIAGVEDPFPINSINFDVIMMP